MSRKFVVLAVLCMALGLSSCTASEDYQQSSVRIIMPTTENVSDPQVNYLKLWLENETGYVIHLELIDSEYMTEYLRLLFSTDHIQVDGIFLGDDIISIEEIERYGTDGLILPLDDWIGQDDTAIHAIFEQYGSYDLKRSITAADGHVYYMPNLQYSDVQRNFQTMWLNSNWLKQTNMPMPQDIDEFREVMQMFKAYAENRKISEYPITITGSAETDSLLLYNYLMNAFVYTDPQHSYLAVEDGEVFFAPATDQWRKGLQYCRSLYQEGLLTEHSILFTSQQLGRIANDPRELIGGFAAQSITDVLLQSSPEMLNNYIYIPPLSGPEGVRYATIRTELPKVGGVITANSSAPDAVFEIMDLMLREEAYLIASFGEKGVDWDDAKPGDISLSGSDATITIRSHEWNLSQNKNFGGYGPYVDYPYYSDGVAWNGYQADQRYIDARASRLYLEYEPDEYIRILSIPDDMLLVQAELEDYAKDMMIAFIIGLSNPASDKDWNNYLDTLEELNMSQLISAAQQSYKEFAKEPL